MMVLEGFTPFPEDLVKEWTAKGYWSGLTTGDVLDKAVRTRPDKEGIVDGRGRITYRELALKVDRLALKLLELGIKKNDIVIVQLPNWAEFVYLFFGLNRIGAIGLMALPQHRRREMHHLLELSGSVAWVIPKEYRSFDYVNMVEEIRPRLPRLKHILVARGEVPTGMISLDLTLEERLEYKYPPGYLQSFNPDPNDVAVILLSGGTTDLPKGVPRTHNDYIHNISAFNRLWNRTSDESLFLNIPIAHNIGLGIGVVSSVLTGAKLVLHTSTKPEDALKTIQQEKIAITFLVPTQVVDLLNSPQLSHYDLSSLRVLGSGAANVAPELVRSIRDKIGCQVINAFGMTEGPCLLTRLNDPFEVICETVGQPCCPEDEIKIVDETGREVPPGVEGELIARGPHIFRGYYKAPEKNKQDFNEEGFFFTGDLATLDHSGNYLITGRKKDMIIRGGENISAVEIEQVLLTHPMIENVAVVGMPDHRLGEKVCVFIKTKGEVRITLEEIITFLKGKEMAVFKLPERIEFVSEFPLTQVGKISKKDLREVIAQKLSTNRGL
jgi:2,3-dihydroxybenzoate-AMP ligase